MLNKEIIPLFSHNIFKYRIDPKLFNKKKILDTINSNYNKKKYRNNWDHNQVFPSNFHHSNKDEDNKNFLIPDYSSLLPIYENIFKNLYTNLKFKTGIKFNFSFDIVNYTCSDEDQFMRKHDHVRDSDFSCVHYLQFDNEHAPTVFYNPSEFIGRETLKLLRNNFFKKLDDNYLENSGYFKLLTLQCEEDDMIIFPSHLEHAVPQVREKYKQNRITIVTNTRIE
jgi:hypothetical protein